MSYDPEKAYALNRIADTLDRIAERLDEVAHCNASHVHIFGMDGKRVCCLDPALTGQGAE